MKVNFKFSQLGICAALMLTVAPSFVQAEPGDAQSLSEGERKDIEEKLEKILSSAENLSDQRFSRALSAFRSAIQSDVAAHELYLQCIEKVNFIDKQKSSQQFRDWKRKHKEREDLTDFRRALRHQLNWLLLSIEVSARPDDLSKFTATAMQKIDTIMSELDTLKSQQSVLKQKVLGTVYAKAYDINGLEAEGWPLSPTDITSVYENVVMPPLRENANIGALRASWDKRIKHVGLMKKNWSKVPDTGRIGVKKNISTPDYEKWLDDGYLKLLWDKEKDCFAAGDEVRASNSMLAHLQKNIKHKLALSWVKEFTELTGIGEAVEINTSTAKEE